MARKSRSKEQPRVRVGEAPDGRGFGKSTADAIKQLLGPNARKFGPSVDQKAKGDGGPRT